MNFQTNTITPPVIIPAKAPCLLERFQNRASRTTGPNVAPKPAHAKDTIRNTEELGSLAINIATMEIPTTARRAILIDAFVDSSTLKNLRIRFSEILEDAARSCASAVDIVEDRIPDRITPPMIAIRTPYLPIRSAILTMIVSDVLPPRKSSAPEAETALPTTPITTATAMEITTHTVAILLDIFSFSLSSIAMKRSRI